MGQKAGALSSGSALVAPIGGLHTVVGHLEHLGLNFFLFTGTPYPPAGLKIQSTSLGYCTFLKKG
jgi:hypothetical protein